MKLALKNNYIIIIISVISAFLLMSAYTLNTNIHGDALTHLMVTESIIKSGDLPKYIPYKIIVSKKYPECNGVPYPIPYPLSSYVIMSLFYFIGGMTLLKLFNPFFGVLSIIYIYLILNGVFKINKLFSCIIAILSVIINIPRIILTPSMEPILLFTTFGGLYYSLKFIEDHRVRYVVLSIFFLLNGISIKQQGIVYFLALSPFLLYMLTKVSKNKSLLLIIPLLVLMFSLPLIEQIERNGTIDVVPTNSRIPLLKSKYPLDPWSRDIGNMICTYWPKYTWIQTIKIFLEYPFFYYRQNFYSNNLLIFEIFLLSIAIFTFHKRIKRLYYYIFLWILIFEVIITKLTNTIVWNYHLVGLSVVVVLLFLGLYQISRWLKKYTKVISPIFVLVFVVLLLIGYANFVHQTYWKNSGRLNDDIVHDYEILAKQVSKKIPNDALILTPEEGFRYFAKRNTTWVSNCGGGELPLIFRERNTSFALRWLKYYNISYIFIDTRQTKWHGVGDYIPPAALEWLKRSKYFEEVINVNNTLLVYKINFSD